MKHLAIAVIVLAAFSSTASASSLPFEPNIVLRQGPGDSFVFPVAGSVQGLNGTHFTSEVTLVNFKNETQEVLVEFLDGSPALTTVRMVFPPTSFRIIDDFVTSQMNRPGILGALRFRAVVAGTNTTDTTAHINGYSRIWTPTPGTGGTSSLALPALGTNMLSAAGQAAYIIGMRQNAQYRTNLGIVNLESVDRLFQVVPTTTVGTNPEPFTVVVPANSLRQIALQAGEWQGVALRIAPANEGAWAAYGASVDNVSGDGWVSYAEYSTRP